MTDEECIATAMLHGADFRPIRIGENKWFVGSDYEWHNIPARDCNAVTKGQAARMYCIRHKLLPEVANEGRHHAA